MKPYKVGTPVIYNNWLFGIVRYVGNDNGTPWYWMEHGKLQGQLMVEHAEVQRVSWLQWLFGRKPK